jgi:3-deoxy-manno-octulosonate cytidylyltransferase (CMP-KDO synthetase)
MKSINGSKESDYHASFKVIIPARYDSTRLPGKVLLDISGKPMIQHTYERAVEATEDPEKVFIATDSLEVVEAAEKFGAQYLLTASTHRSGTERLLEAVDQLGLFNNNLVVNVQADEPLLPPVLIRQVAENLWKNQADVATLYDNIITEEALHDPAVVKVVTDKDHFALYFSRAPIPFHRDGINWKEIGKRHIGLYSYRVETLREYSKSFSSCHLEETEMLEQLRLLYHGKKIHVDLAREIPELGVDTPEDLDNIRLALKLKNL